MWNIITKNVANFGVELGPGNFLGKHVDLLFKGRLCGMYSSWVKTFLAWLKAEAYKAPSDIVVQIGLRKLIKITLPATFPVHTAWATINCHRGPINAQHGTGSTGHAAFGAQKIQGRPRLS